MAIKIDLLPGYVKWTKRLRYTIAGAIVGLGLWTGGLLLAYHSKQLELETAEKNRDVVQEIATRATAAKTATDAAVSAAGGYNAANDFFLASTKSGSERAALLNLITRYIYENSVVESVDVSDGRTVTIVAKVTTPDEYAQFLTRLRNAEGVLFLNNPRPRLVTTGVGGFGNGAQPLVVPQPEPGGPDVVVNFPITLTAQATLINPLTVPADPTGGAAPAGGPGGPGGPPVGPPTP